MPGKRHAAVWRLVIAMTIAALIGGCNVGVGMNVSVPAPWGYVSMGAGTSFPTHPGW
jgi:hypothetical protein